MGEYIAKVEGTGLAVSTIDIRIDCSKMMSMKAQNLRRSLIV